MRYSVIVPVYNRPEELRELLETLAVQTRLPEEVLVIEDGSAVKSEETVLHFQNRLPIRYYYQENTGQGFARNFGFKQATGDYFVIFDSDALVPPEYLEVVDRRLQTEWLDAYGGPDAAHPDFTPIQKAISYSMTSLFTTGGIRGRKNNLGGKFHPRSFNMGFSRKVYETVGGYKITRMGEDIEFAIRIINAGFKTALVSEAFIYHKRRTNFWQFFRQLHFFGRARVNITRFFPSELKLVHLLPALFTLFIGSIPFFLLISSVLFGLSLGVLMLFALLIFIDAATKERSLKLGFLGVIAAFVQLIGYGVGFLSEGWKWLYESKGYQETGANLEYPS